MKTNNSIAQVFFGLMLVVLGVGFLLDTLDIFNFSHYLKDWWPLFLVGAGLASLLSNPRLWVWPVIIMAVGGAILLRTLEVVQFNIWSLIWPFMIIFFGISMIFKKTMEPSAVKEGTDTVDLVAIFSGHKVNQASQNFTGGKLTAVFGGIELDLTGTTIQQGATLDVFTAFGGVDLRVPEGWEVKVQGVPIFGGWENKARVPKTTDAPVLLVRGTCLFGGFEVKN